MLNTPRAIQMSVYVVRAFVRLRELAGAHAALSAQLDALERRVTGHDEDLAQVIATLRSLLAKPVKPRQSIGFTAATAPRRPLFTRESAAQPPALPAPRRLRSGRSTIQR